MAMQKFILHISNSPGGGGFSPWHRTYVHVYAFWCFFTNFGIVIKEFISGEGLQFTVVYVKKINIQKHPIYVFLCKIGILMSGR